MAKLAIKIRPDVAFAASRHTKKIRPDAANATSGRIFMANFAIT